MRGVPRGARRPQKLRAALRARSGIRPCDAGAPLPRIAAALDREAALAPQSRRVAPQIRDARSGPSGAALFAGMGGVAARGERGVPLFVAPIAVNPLFNDLVNAHVRSLMPAHLIDVESTDRHTVKPWFAGHADVSPAVVDFRRRGLSAGRRPRRLLRSAARGGVVYQHGAHIINVFSWADDRGSLPDDTTRNGYHLAFWRDGESELLRGLGHRLGRAHEARESLIEDAEGRQRLAP